MIYRIDPFKNVRMSVSLFGGGGSSRELANFLENEMHEEEEDTRSPLDPALAHSLMHMWPKHANIREMAQLGMADKQLFEVIMGYLNEVVRPGLRQISVAKRGVLWTAKAVKNIYELARENYDKRALLDFSGEVSFDRGSRHWIGMGDAALDLYEGSTQLFSIQELQFIVLFFCIIILMRGGIPTILETLRTSPHWHSIEASLDAGDFGPYDALKLFFIIKERQFTYRYLGEYANRAFFEEERKRKDYSRNLANGIREVFRKKDFEKVYIPANEALIESFGTHPSLKLRACLEAAAELIIQHPLPPDGQERKPYIHELAAQAVLPDSVTLQAKSNLGPHHQLFDSVSSILYDREAVGQETPDALRTLMNVYIITFYFMYKVRYGDNYDEYPAVGEYVIGSELNYFLEFLRMIPSVPEDASYSGLAEKLNGKPSTFWLGPFY